MERMRIYFEYPLATEENMKAVQDAVDSGKDICELVEMFDEEVLWDCVAVLSGNKDTPWAVLDHMDGYEQYSPEGWQREVIDDYIGACEFLRSLSDRDELAIRIEDKILLIQSYSEGGWDAYLVNERGELLEDGGILGDEKTPIEEVIRELLQEYQMPMDRPITLLPNFRELWERAMG